jgi:hypothetical protein
MQGNRQFFSEVGDDGLSRKRYVSTCALGNIVRLSVYSFRTSGNVVIVLTALSVAAYITLLVLTLRLDA